MSTDKTFGNICSNNARQPVFDTLRTGASGIWRISPRLRIFLVLSFLASCAVVILELGLAVAVGNAIHSAFSDVAPQKQFGLPAALNHVSPIVLFLCIGIGRSIAIAVANTLSHLAETEFSGTVQLDVIRALESNLQRNENEEQDGVWWLLIQGVGVVSRTLASGLLLVRIMIVVLGLSIGMFLANPSATFSSFLALILLAIGLRVVQRHSVKSALRAVAASERFTENVQRLRSNLLYVQVLRSQSSEISNALAASKQNKSTEAKSRIMSASWQPITDITGTCLVALTLSLSNSDGAMTMSYLYMLVRLAQYLSWGSSILADIYRGAPATDKVLKQVNLARTVNKRTSDTLEHIHQQVSTKTAQSENFASSAPPAIILEGCHVSAGSQTKLIELPEMSISAGSVACLVGPSGSGKTTAIRTIVGLQQVVNGKCNIGGYSSEDFYRMHNLRIGFVGPDPMAFYGRLKDCLHDPRSAPPSDQSLENLLFELGLRGVINALPEKLNTYITDGHGPFSAGELQRLTIARALMSKPQLLILDEFTSHLDPTSEKAILDRIGKLRGTCTIVIATHSAAVEKIVDTIYRFPSQKHPSTLASA